MSIISKQEQNRIIEKMKSHQKNGDLVDGVSRIFFDKYYQIDEDMMKKIATIKMKKNSKQRKIMELYNEICRRKIYDSNYNYAEGYDINQNFKDEEWIANRVKHNRMVCWEIAQYIAKCIDLLEIPYSNTFCVLNDKGHVVVYYEDETSLVEFESTNRLGNIRMTDLVKSKVGLPLEGIRVLEDKNGEFKDEVKAFETERGNISDGNLTKCIKELARIREERKKKEPEERRPVEDPMEYIEAIRQMLIDNDIIESDFYSVMLWSIKVILNIEGRDTTTYGKKTDDGKRYTDCLVFEYNGRYYFIDTYKQTLMEISEEEKKFIGFNSDMAYYNQREDIGYRGE